MDIDRNRSISSKRRNDDEKEENPSKRTNITSKQYELSRDITDISDLKPGQGEWTIIGKCYAKTDLRTWNRNGKNGTVFSFEIRDLSGDIRVAAFNDECIKFFNEIQNNVTCIISNGKIRHKKEIYNFTKHNYEITLDRTSEVIMSAVQFDVDGLVFDFVQLSDLKNTKVETIIDVIGVVIEISDEQDIVRNTDNTRLVKKEIYIVDKSNYAIMVTLWNDAFTRIPIKLHDILIIKRGKLNNYRNKSISTMGNTLMLINDFTVDKTQQIYEWFQSTEIKPDPEYLTTMRPTEGITNMIYKHTFYFSLIASIVEINKTDIFIKVCITCNTKLMTTASAINFCYGCNKFADYHYHLFLYIKIQDSNFSDWIIVENEPAEYLLNETAKSLQLMKNNDIDAFHNTFDSIIKDTFMFQLKIKSETKGFTVSAINISSVDKNTFSFL